MGEDRTASWWLLPVVLVKWARAGGQGSAEPLLSIQRITLRLNCSEDKMD